MSRCVSRGQVINRLLEARFHFNRRGERVDIYRQSGSGQRVDVPLKDLLPLITVRAILKQAGCTPSQVEKFLNDCEVEDSYPH